ncbi:MAG: substrate-binding domain-containing protein [Planctomycetales bacterium]|nr:substrate-binding domain-containing protein [Planctomycetales bacterium]
MPIRRAGQVSSFFVVSIAAVLLLIAFGAALFGLGSSGGVPAPGGTVSQASNSGQTGESGESGDSSKANDTEGGSTKTPRDRSTSSLLMYCAAGMRLPVEQIAKDYEREYGVSVQLQYGGSNTLLSQLTIARTGGLYLAGDDSYIQMAQDSGLVKEAIPLATMRPVIAVKKGNPKQIRGVDDLLRDDVTTVVGNPDQAAIGKKTRSLLTKSGHWERLERHITDTGVFKPTVPEVANDVKLGSIDAGIVWDSTLALYPDLEAIRVPELDAGTALVSVGIITGEEHPQEALKFARYLAASDRGLVTFEKSGFEVVEGDVWAERPEITFFCGSVNRRAVERLLRNFEQREGVVVNTVYNGCGILTAQMKTIRDQRQGAGFPDTYMACDRYYLDNVKEWFQEDVDISDTEVVIAVPKGNPANIRSLKDLTKEGMRVAIGQPEQCTIGVLTLDLLKAEGIMDEVMKNVVTQTATSALLLPTVTTRSVDAALTYATDTQAEGDKVDTIAIHSEAATAVQPFAIASSSQHKELSRRLYRTVAAARTTFEAVGFHFRLDTPLISGKTVRRGGE